MSNMKVMLFQKVTLPVIIPLLILFMKLIMCILFFVIVKKYKPAVGMKTTSNFNKRTADSAGSELRQKRINCRSIGECKYPISDHNSP